VLIRFTALLRAQRVDLPAKQVDLREAEVQVPSDRVAELKLVLAASCYGRIVVDPQGAAQPTCADPAQSCQPDTGMCGPTLVDPATLPTYTPRGEADAGA
jgi:hypothetical protein